MERKLALGSYSEITLAEARSARDAARRQVAHAVDPNAAKRQARIEASKPDALDVARQYIPYVHARAWQRRAEYLNMKHSLHTASLRLTL